MTFDHANPFTKLLQDINDQSTIEKSVPVPVPVPWFLLQWKTAPILAGVVHRKIGNVAGTSLCCEAGIYIDVHIFWTIALWSRQYHSLHLWVWESQWWKVYSESTHTRRATMPQNWQGHWHIKEIVTEMAIMQVLWTQSDVAMRDFPLHIYGECCEVVLSWAKGDQ